MKTIYFIRHGDYSPKTEDIYDSERFKARLMGQNMNPKPQIIYTSPTLRAKTTAECIAEGAGVKIEIDGRLEEFSTKDMRENFFKDLFPALEKNNIDTIAIISHQPTLKKMTSSWLRCLESLVIQKETWNEYIHSF